jgi:hypothetical protein
LYKVVLRKVWRYQSSFFLKKYSDSQCCWKNILILVEGEKKSDYNI